MEPTFFAIARRAPSRAVTSGLFVGLAGAVLIALPSLGEGPAGTRSSISYRRYAPAR